MQITQIVRPFHLVPTRASLSICCLLAAVVLCPIRVEAQDASEPTTALWDLSLEELLNVKVLAPTLVARPLRESPAVVTVVTRDDIVRSGARDMIDVLHLVPGFFFGVDVFGTVGLGFRGNWGLEGKILVLVDGHEMNETLFLTVLFGNHFPVEHIDRIEVVRGPGSVVYGGYAELAVISITTRDASTLDGVFASIENGQMDGTRGHTHVNLAGGHAFENNVTLSASALFGDGIRSTATYRDIAGTAYSLKDAQIDPRVVTVKMGWQGLNVRYLLDNYNLTARDAFDVSLPSMGQSDFHQHHVAAEFKWQPRKNLTLTPHFSYKRQTQYNPGPPPAYYFKTGEKYSAGLTSNVTIDKHVSLLAGGEWSINKAHLDDLEHLGTGGQFLFADGVQDRFRTVAGFSELTVTHRLANLSTGLRVENNERFGTAVLPRVGVTRVFRRRFHTKLLFSKAFKAPGHENFALNVNLRPERTTAYELETGYQTSSHTFAAVSLFDTSIRDPIIFFFDPVALNGTYINETKTGTRGVEAQYRWKYPRWQADLQYSFYRVIKNDSVALYAVPGQPNVHRGLPAHKLTLNSSIDLARGLSLNPSVLYLGARYGTLDVIPGGGPGLGQEGPTWLLNAFLLYEKNGLSLRGGVHNLLDQPLRFLQPYDSGHAPYPGPTREWVMRAGYTYAFGRSSTRTNQP